MVVGRKAVALYLRSFGRSRWGAFVRPLDAFVLETRSFARGRYRWGPHCLARAKHADYTRMEDKVITLQLLDKLSHLYSIICADAAETAEIR